MLLELKFTDFLKNEFEQRKLTNSSYSLRAFARDISVSPSRLSEILAEKGNLSNLSAKKIAKKLRLKEKEEEIFISLVNINNASSKKSKKEAQEYLKSLRNENQTTLSLESFNLVSEWYYFAILSVMELDLFDGSAHWIAQRLGVEYSKIEKALETLTQLEFIQKKNDKFELLSTNGVSTTSDIESMALRKSHKQTLNQAISALDNVDVNLRDITSITMAIDPKKIPEAKKIIKNFRREMCAFLESGKKEEVYNLNIQLIPITNLQTKPKENL